MSDQNTQDFVQCALFGESFNLRCAKEQKKIAKSDSFFAN